MFVENKWKVTTPSLLDKIQKNNCLLCVSMTTSNISNMKFTSGIWENSKFGF